MKRTAILLAVAGLLVLLLACGSGGVAVSRTPRWACPSPTPLPWGTEGPLKAVITHTRPITAGGDWDEFFYFAEWEREYGALGGPPFPSPTPYALVGTNYVLGQRVEIWPFHVQAQAVAGPFVTAPGVAADRQQLALITLTWHNHTLDPLPVQYSEQVRLRAVIDPNGALVSDGRWGVSAQALQLAGIAALPTTVPPGLSTVTIPVIGPRGIPHVVELSLFADPDALPRLPTTTTLPGTPTSTALIVPPTATPSPNQDLRVLRTEPLTLQWSAATWQAPGAPPCPDPGALTDWEAEPLQVWGREVAIRGVAAPPGAERLVQIALAQVGKPYVWGAKGPERFDCSGLMSWAYAQIGLVIPQGTAGQWPRMRAVTSADLRPGDLVFFAIAGGGIDHVGMLVGDLNGDGEWDLVHAASPRLGVRVDYNIFSSSYYAPRIRGFRTAR